MQAEEAARAAKTVASAERAINTFAFITVSSFAEKFYISLSEERNTSKESKELRGAEDHSLVFLPKVPSTKLIRAKPIGVIIKSCQKVDRARERVKE